MTEIPAAAGRMRKAEDRPLRNGKKDKMRSAQSETADAGREQKKQKNKKQERGQRCQIPKN